MSDARLKAALKAAPEVRAALMEYLSALTPGAGTFSRRPVAGKGEKKNQRKSEKPLYSW